MTQEIYSYDWFSQHIPSWQTIFAPMRGKPALNFLEIGSFEGRSACWLLHNVLTHESSRLTCVDLFPETMGGDDEFMPRQSRPDSSFDHNIALTGAAHRVTKIRGSSEDVLRGLPSACFDFIYIDGSHHAPYVLTDAVLSWRCLKVGGMLGFDDYQWGTELPEVIRPQLAVDAFMKTFAGMFELIHSDYQVFIRKTEGLQAW
jgi:predicted O-methyltransferase YrrM